MLNDKLTFTILQSCGDSEDAVAVVLSAERRDVHSSTECECRVFVYNSEQNLQEKNVVERAAATAFNDLYSDELWEEMPKQKYTIEDLQKLAGYNNKLLKKLGPSFDVTKAEKGKMKKMFTAKMKGTTLPANSSIYTGVRDRKNKLRKFYDDNKDATFDAAKPFNAKFKLFDNELPLIQEKISNLASATADNYRDAFVSHFGDSWKNYLNYARRVFY